MPLTYFEYGTLAAAWLFASERLDAAVLEVGLGGRLDAVNAIEPDCAVVTSIGTDSFVYCASLTAITVAPDNPYYSGLDGVLFDKSQTTVVAFPSGSAGAYSVPSSVTHIGDGAFRSSSLSSILFRGDAPLYLGSDSFFQSSDQAIAAAALANSNKHSS